MVTASLREGAGMGTAKRYRWKGRISSKSTPKMILHWLVDAYEMNMMQTELNKYWLLLCCDCD